MKIGSSRDLSWTVVEARKKKKNKSKKSSNLQGNENDLEFEVVFPKNEFLQMASSKQGINCEENLKICKNHFSLEKCPGDSSDSEIEVVECPDENSSKNTRLYSKVLLRNLPLEKDDISNQLMESSFEGIKDLLNEENYLEDSDIEILSRTNAQSTLDLDLSIYVNEIEREKKMSNESLEIIFDDNWHAGLFEEQREELITHEDCNINAEKVDDDVKTCLRFCHSKCYCERLFDPIKNSVTKRVNEADKMNRYSVDSDDEEFGIKKMFETAASDVEDVEDVMTMRTSTLTMLFCIIMIVAVHAGNGFGCAFLKDKSTTTPVVNVIEPDEDSSFVLENNGFENLNLKSIRASSETKSALKSLLTSFRLLQEKHNQLLDIHDETIKNFNIQKQMTWYWRRKVNLNQNENTDYKDPTKKEPGTHQFLVNGYEDIIRKLNTSLEEAKIKAKIWKKKYSSRKLQNIWNYPEILKDKHLSDFLISKCLYLFSNALNIDRALLNLSTPLHVFKKHVRSVWSNIRNNWTKRKAEKETAQFDVDKFRKIFTISNLVSFGLAKEKSQEKKKISEKKEKNV